VQLTYDISALACKGDLTFAAVRGTIVECKRMHRSGEYRGHSADIIQMLVLGDRLLSLGRDGKLLAWRIGDYEEPEVGPAAFLLSRAGSGERLRSGEQLRRASAVQMQLARWGPTPLLVAEGMYASAPVFPPLPHQRPVPLPWSAAKPPCAAPTLSRPCTDPAPPRAFSTKHAGGYPAAALLHAFLPLPP
jgi:hypothetical protein